MKKFAVALLFCGVSTFAATVNYTTLGAFGVAAPASAASVTVGGATISYAGAIPTSADGAGTFTNVGTFTVTDLSSTPSTFSTTFTLDIVQTSPAGTGSTSSLVSGNISSNGSTIQLTFSPTTLNINGAMWTFSPTPINQPSVAGGVTTVQEFVTLAPEPSTIGLLGASLAGLGIAFRRRRAE